MGQDPVQSRSQVRSATKTGDEPGRAADEARSSWGGAGDQGVGGMRDQALVPQSIVGAMAALDRMEAELDASATYERIIRISKYARAIEFLFGEVDRVKRRSQVVIAHANHRIGEELQKQPKAPPGPPAGGG